MNLPLIRGPELLELLLRLVLALGSHQKEGSQDVAQLIFWWESESEATVVYLGISWI